VLSIYLKLTALFESRHLDTATVSWVLIATALASCTIGVTPAIKNNITANSTNNTKHLSTDGGCFELTNSHAKFSVLTVVLLGMQTLWDVTCVTT
jgi:hypothetical protein